VFDHLSAFQTAKLWLTTQTGLAKDALHVYVGLLILFGSARLLKRRIGEWRPLSIVIAVAVAGEIWDIRDVLVSYGKPDLSANWHDIWNTCFWPIGVTALARYTTLFRAEDVTQ